jgi:cytidylate kinase
MIITIDGPAGRGKSMMAKLFLRELRASVVEMNSYFNASAPQQRRHLGSVHHAGGVSE